MVSRTGIARNCVAAKRHGGGLEPSVYRQYSHNSPPYLLQAKFQNHITLSNLGHTKYTLVYGFLHFSRYYSRFRDTHSGLRIDTGDVRHDGAKRYAIHDNHRAALCVVRLSDSCGVLHSILESIINRRKENPLADILICSSVTIILCLLLTAAAESYDNGYNTAAVTATLATAAVTAAHEQDD